MPKELEKQYRLVSKTTLPEDPTFDRKNYRLRHVYQKDGFVFLSSANENGENYLFEVYKDRKVKLKKPDFIKGVEKLRELYKKQEEIDKKIELLTQKIDENHDSLKRPNSTFEYAKMKELLEEDLNSDFEHKRLQKWYKRTAIRAFYEAIKFMGYEHEWPEISKNLPSIFQLPKEKMERYCDKGTLVAYNRLFGELWSDKPYPNPFVVGAEMTHIIEDHKNQGRNVKLNSLQKEHEEWVEKMVELHMMKQMGYDLKLVSSDKEIENMQTVMRFGPQDPHAGYYEADLHLLEKIEKMSPSERREALSFEGYKKWIVENAKTRKKRFSTALNMLNVMVGTPINEYDEQIENIGVIRGLILPKKG